MDPVAPRSEGFEHHPYAPQTDFFDTTVTNQARPLTQAVITVRVIKNFEYRTMKALVLKDVDLTTLTTPQLIAQCKEAVRTQPGFKAYRNTVDQLDTIKLYTQAHGAKTTNLIINLDHPERTHRRGGTTLPRRCAAEPVDVCTARGTGGAIQVGFPCCGARAQSIRAGRHVRRRRAATLRRAQCAPRL